MTKPEKEPATTSETILARMAESLREHMAARGDLAPAAAGAEALRRALAVLPPADVLLLFLTHGGGLDVPTVAKMLGVKRPEVAAGAARARRRLERELASPDPDEFDAEFAGDAFGLMPPEAKAAWQKAKRRPGRPRQGRGAKVIAVSLERRLLARSDALARRRGVPRSALIAEGLREVLAQAEET